MKIDRLYTRTALATTTTAPLSHAAAEMQRFGVGSLLVMDEHKHAVGIVTDRDIALNVFRGTGASVSAAMTPVLASVGADADTHEALGIMRAHGVRRLAVRDAKGEVMGLLSIDDVIDGLATDLAAAAAVLQGEIRRDAACLGSVAVAVS